MREASTSGAPGRRWLRMAGLVALVAATFGCGAPEAEQAPADATPERPNILFLFSDDQRADALGAYGNPYVSTPTLDALARRGFNFREAHIMGSHHGAVCAPSRAMLMSGRTLFRVYDDLDSVETFPEVLRRNGYVTFGTGKWHQSRESFARSFSLGRNVFFGGMSDHEAVPLQDLLPDGGFTEVRTAGFSTDLFVDAAIEFLEGHAASDAETPFLAYVPFTAPHDPRTPPEPYRSMYAGAGHPLPPNFMPVHPFHNGWMTGRDEQLAAWPRRPEVIREQLGGVLRPDQPRGCPDRRPARGARQHGPGRRHRGRLRQRQRPRPGQPRPARQAEPVRALHPRPADRGRPRDPGRGEPGAGHALRPLPDDRRSHWSGDARRRGGSRPERPVAG